MADQESFAAVVRQVHPGARLLSARRLTGGVSADVHALEFEDADGRLREVVVRQHRAAGWKPEHGLQPRQEYDLLRTLHRTGLPVPGPILLETSGEILPGPYLVMTFVSGESEIAPGALEAGLDAMARVLIDIHEVPVDELPTLPTRLDPLPELFDYLPPGDDFRQLRSYLEGCTDTTYHGAPALLHGDFWPGNLLWRNQHLVGVLDWEDAAMGDPVCDVAGCRLELVWKYGAHAAERFTRSYARQRPIDGHRLALWEVYVASAGARFVGEWGLEAALADEMRHKALAFIRSAGERLVA